MTFKFIDLFAGIGGFRLALESQGGICVFSSEWDRFSQKTYHENFGEMPAGDITQIKENSIPKHDILCGGFPCQPFSIAGVSKKLSLGKAHGFADEAQGNLFFDIARILKNKRPKAFILENVKNLKSHDRGRTFQIINETLDALGYEVFTQIVDAQDYVPQHRERVFLVGYRRDTFKNASFSFPTPPRMKISVSTILESKVDKKYTLSDKLWKYLQEYAIKHQNKGNGFGFGLVDPQKDKITRTLSARYFKDGSEILIKQKGKNPRRLTPRECARLMGFSDKFKIPVSDTQAYRQFGNAVVVPVVSAIAKQLIETLNSNGQDIKASAKHKHGEDQIQGYQTGTRSPTFSP